MSKAAGKPRASWTRFDEVRACISELRNLPYCRLEMREFRHRVLGSNSVPAEVWIDSFDNAIALIGKRREVTRFAALLALTRQQQPALLDWLAKKPLRALDLAEVWEQLLAVVTWIQRHPRPDIYLRQIDIFGVHSKFIEAQRGVLIELLDSSLPAEAIDSRASGVSQFARRYGFRDKPLRIRFRLLDSGLLPSALGQDITLNAEHFARLSPPVTQVFITENEINFLAFPPVQGSLVIFGAGYGFEALSQAGWLADCRMFYWGDIDTHGFAILDQLRSQFPQTESLLMDNTTLLAFAAHWGKEEKPTLRELPRLTPEERSLYNDLRDNRLGQQLRLEQERIGFGWLEAALAKLSTRR